MEFRFCVLERERESNKERRELQSEKEGAREYPSICTEAAIAAGDEAKVQNAGPLEEEKKKKIKQPNLPSPGQGSHVVVASKSSILHSLAELYNNSPPQPPPSPPPFFFFFFTGFLLLCFECVSYIGSDKSLSYGVATYENLGLRRRFMRVQHILSFTISTVGTLFCQLILVCNQNAALFLVEYQFLLRGFSRE